jgi:alkylation response protein AidB-like acyl-CoA dehydrogenase
MPVWLWGTSDQQVHVAAALGDGAFGAFALTEREAGSDITATSTRADRSGAGFRLNGEKWLISNATRGAFATVLARSDPFLSFFLVEKSGVDPTAISHLPKVKTLGLRGHELSGIGFQNCNISADAHVGPAGRGAEMVLGTFHYTRTMIAGMCLGGADSALRIALSWARSRRLYGDEIYRISAVRELLVGAFVDILVCECVSISAARALTAAGSRVALWSAVTKFFVPVTCEAIIRDLAVVMSARYYLRESVACGMFQKIARDVDIASIFEGTQLIQLALIASQLAHASPGMGNDDEDGRLDAVFSLGSQAPSWDPADGRFRIATRTDDTSETLGASLDALNLLRESSSVDQDVLDSAIALCVELRTADEELRAEIGAFRDERRGARAMPAIGFGVARTHCVVHAAAVCLRMWLSNRELLGGSFSEGKWLVLSLERLLDRLGRRPHSSSSCYPEYQADVAEWMLQVFDDKMGFSMIPIQLA